MSEKSPLIELFALWEMPSGKGFSGKLGNSRVLVFRNDRKTNPKAPDLRVYVTKDDREAKSAAREPGSDDVDDVPGF